MTAVATQLDAVTPQNETGSATALVLCGGGGHGALEVGFARALTELGIRYDRILGTSIGALNGAFLAGGMSPGDLAALWKDARLWRLVRPNWSWILHPCTRPGLLSLSPLGRFLERNLPMHRFEDLKIPLTVVTTDLVTGKACYWEGPGDIVAPLLASMSLPGIFPPVTLREHPHIDGGVADNAPLGRAAGLGIRRALMIECACADPCRRPPSGLTGILGRTFEIALARNHRAELARHARRMEIVRVVPRLDSDPELLDLSQAEALMEIGYFQSMSALPALLVEGATSAEVEKCDSRVPRYLRVPEAEDTR